MENSLILRPCAKINLTMEVFQRRADGYHEVRSVLQSVSLRDRLILTPLPGRELEFSCDVPELGGEDNLVMRAYRLLEARHPLGGVRMRLEKAIPCQSGMGGGSADCAGALRGLCRLFGLELPREELMALGAELGADVPACLDGRPVLAEGIGEKLTPLEAGPPLELVILMPPAAFSTPEMYRRLDRREVLPSPVPLDGRIRGLAAGVPGAVAKGLCNHFEKTAPCGALIAGAKAALLSAGAVGASMTGAGAAVFGVFESAAAADRAADMLRDGPCRSFRCRTLADAWETEDKRGEAG